MLDLKEYDGIMASNTEFFTTADATPVFRDIIEHLKRKAIKPAVDENFWKLTFSIPDGKSSIDVKVKLLKVSHSKLAVTFTRKKGNQLKFFDHYKQMMNDPLVGSYRDTVLSQ